jgi:signal transduction histidine kinase
LALHDNRLALATVHWKFESRSFRSILSIYRVVMDVTEQHLDEQRKNDFIAMVSHELKTPLTSLLGIIQISHLKLKNSEDVFLAGAMEKSNPAGETDDQYDQWVPECFPP